MLCCVVLCCIVLYCIVLYCNVLYCIVLYCNVCISICTHTCTNLIQEHQQKPSTCDPGLHREELKVQDLELNVIVVNGAISACAASGQWQQEGQIGHGEGRAMEDMLAKLVQITPITMVYR